MIQLFHSSFDLNSKHKCRWTEAAVTTIKDVGANLYYSILKELIFQFYWLALSFFDKARQAIVIWMVHICSNSIVLFCFVLFFFRTAIIPLSMSIVNIRLPWSTCPFLYFRSITMIQLCVWYKLPKGAFVKNQNMKKNHFIDWNI